VRGRATRRARLARRRRQVHDARAQPASRAAWRLVEVALQRHDARGPRNSGTRAGDDVSASRRTRAAGRAPSRRPTSPQPTMSTRSRRKRLGRAPRGSGLRAKSDVQQTTRARGYPKHDQPPRPPPAPSRSPCSPAAALFSVDAGEPSSPAAIRQGIGLPYGCKDGACGSCKCKKLEGTWSPRRPPEQGAVGRGRSQRLRAHLLRGAADRRGARVAPGHRRKRLPDRKMPSRVPRWRRSRTT
jgi:ferredoxin